MTTETQLTPVEQALVALREAQDALLAATLDLATKAADAFAEEHFRVTELGILLNTRKQQLVDAIGANGPLPAEAKSEVGWAHYSGAMKRVYAPVDAWNKALVEANLAHLVAPIIIESVNTTVVDKLCQTNGEFHRAVEGLIVEKASKPVLRYGFTQEGKQP